MSFHDISGDASTIKSLAFQKKYDFDIDTLRIQLKDANEASKKLHKEQKDIQRKRQRSKSKQLQKCMNSYDENLTILEEAFQKIDPVLNEKSRDVGSTSKPRVRSLSLNVPKKKERKEIPFELNESTECRRCFSKDDVIRKLKEEKDRIQRNSEQNIRQLTESVDSLQAQLGNLQRKYEEEVRAKESALNRLSNEASSKLRDNNPNITDLSDQNRPTKIAEKLSELYDNQWTDAFDLLEKETNEGQIIATLLDTLMTAYGICCKLSSKDFFERVQQCMELPAEVPEIQNYKVVLSDQQKQEIKEFRKTRASYVLRDIEKVVRPRLRLGNHQSDVIQSYVSLCVEIGWLCAVQDPPVVLDATFTEKFDAIKFKDYTQRGNYVEFVVWPAMYLHNRGPLLSKGVAQGCDQKRNHKDSDSFPTTRGSNNVTGQKPSTGNDGRFSNQPRKQNENYPRDEQNLTRRNQTYDTTHNKSKTTYVTTSTHYQGYASTIHHQDNVGRDQLNQYNNRDPAHDSQNKQYRDYGHGHHPDDRGNFYKQDIKNKSKTLYSRQMTSEGTGAKPNHGHKKSTDF